jgi:hypothetical protein
MKFNKVRSMVARMFDTRQSPFRYCPVRGLSARKLKDLGNNVPAFWCTRPTSGYRGFSAGSWTDPVHSRGT